MIRRMYNVELDEVSSFLFFEEEEDEEEIMTVFPGFFVPMYLHDS